ncbi:MAG: 2-oxoacid:acceptor oxidoreductase family protein [Patescibacteria group bacterium]|nr:2-oxoacid:acceptor oxidoreductase family protein [Patescibacteria group bacterium]
MLSETKSAFGGKKVNITISGEGGQGIQTIAKILIEAAVDVGFEAAYMPVFGVEQRGTPSVAHITISNQKLRYPKFDIADYAIILQSRAIKVIERYVSPNTKVIFDSSTISEKDLPKTSVHLLGLPATKIANEQFSPKSFNIIVLGALTKLLDIPEKNIWQLVLKVLGKKFKTEEIKNINKEALLFGRETIFEKSKFTKAIYRTKHKAVIFKGYNKTGQIFPGRCKGCGICILKCPVGALSFSEDLGLYATPIPKVDLEKCIACGNCRNFCPDGAINIEKDSNLIK